MIALGFPLNVLASSQDSQSTKPRIFFESGFLVGEETKLRCCDDSRFRLHSEVGVELHRPSPRGYLGNRYGFALTGSLGELEMRFGFGPRATWRLKPELGLQALAGLVWSSEAEYFKQGWQVRSGLLYDNKISLTTLWQMIPYEDDEFDQGSGHRHSVYGGFMLHGGTGGITSLAVWAAIAAVFIAYLSSAPQ
jgi:hypothetical protein